MRTSPKVMTDLRKRSEQKHCESKESADENVNGRRGRHDSEKDENDKPIEVVSSESDFNATNKSKQEFTGGKLDAKSSEKTTVNELDRKKSTSRNLNAKKDKNLSYKIQEETVQESSALFKIFLYASVPVLIVVVVAFAPYILPEEMTHLFLYKSNSYDRFNYPKIFEDRLKVLQKNFTNQKERFWRILRSRSLAHLRNKKPSQPLVVLLGAPPSAHSVVDCLAKKLAWCLDPEYSSSNFIDGNSYSKDEGHQAKKALDTTLKEIFQRGVRSALVMHLEKLPPPSPLLFYSYCDNDEAPYKHAGIIFTVHLPHEPSASLSPVEAEGSIETFLSEVAWSEYPYESDSISALLSRIADTVALVSQESDSVVQSVCEN